MEKGGLKQCRSPFLIHLLLVVILLLGGRSQADDSRVRGHFKCTNRQYGTSESNEEQATDLSSSKPVETTPKQTTSSETTGSTVREATNLSSSKPVETTPKQTTSSETTGSTVREAPNQPRSTTPVESTTESATTEDSHTDDMHTSTNSPYCKPRKDVPIMMKDCLDVFNAGFTDTGIYTITPTNWNGTFDVFCNMTDGGGWTVFQRRVNGSVDFYRNWTSYKEGFGDPCHEFWLGNDKLSLLTNQGNYEIRIDIVNKYGNPYYAKYDLFRINDESDNYRLSELGAYNGTADTGHKLDKAGLEYHRNQVFSTYDRDNDDVDGVNCAVKYHGAWWYKKCHSSNLNGGYHAVDEQHDGSISWKFPTGWYVNIKYTEMKIRPVEI